MQSRKESIVSKWLEGAATRQSNRANGYPATRRKPVRSISELEEPEQWSRGKVFLAVFAGSLFLYAFMWLAAAY